MWSDAFIVNVPNLWSPLVPAHVETSLQKLACNGVAMHAVRRTGLNIALGV
jgi:hypothetical protein